MKELEAIYTEQLNIKDIGKTYYRNRYNGDSYRYP